MSSKTARSAASDAGGPPPAFGALPAAILSQVFAYASALDGTYLDDDMDVRIGVLGMPSWRLKTAVDSKECARIAAVVCAAGMAFLRPVAKAFREAADEVGVRVHVENFGFRPADSTTTEREEDDEEDEEEDEEEEVDEFESFEARTPRAPIMPFLGAPQAALLDRAHAMLALRSANFFYGYGCDCCWRAKYGEALARTFWARASRMPWTIEAWHVFVTRPGVKQHWRGWDVPFDAEFDPHETWNGDAACQRLRDFAVALVPPESRSKIKELPARTQEEQSMLRLDLFGSPTHWVDYDEGAKCERSWQTIRHERLEPGVERPKPGRRIFALRGSTPLTRSERCGGWWDNRPDERRAEPPAEVIPNFCAFSFRPGLHDVHKPDYIDCACCMDETQRRRGGFAVRVADLGNPNEEDDADGVPWVVLDTVCFEQGAVHLDFKVPGSPLLLTVSGTVHAMPPPERSDAFCLRHWKGASPTSKASDGDTADRKYLRKRYFINEDELFETEEKRLREHSRLAEELRSELPRGLGTPGHPTLTGKSQMRC